MAFHVEEVVGIKTVGDMIAALEEFPDELPVRLGDKGSLCVRRVKPAPDEVFRRRIEFIQIGADHDED